MWTVCVLLFGLVLIGCGLAVFWCVRQITEQELSQPDAEPRIVPIRPEVHRSPWKDSAHTIVLSAEQQAELMRIYREEYVEQCVWPEMPLLAFFRAVEDHQRPDKPLEVEVLFAQRQYLRSLAISFQLDWLSYALATSERKELLT